MLSRTPMFDSFFGRENARQGRGRIPFLVEPGAPGRAVPASARQPMAAASVSPVAMATPAPTGAYKMKPETRGQLVSAVARAKDPLSGVPHGQVVSAIAKGQAPAADTTEAAKADLEKKAKKLRQQAAQVGVLRNQAVNKPPVLSAPDVSTAALPATLPSATRFGMAVNKLV